jgi:acyl-CoA synthetase (AMP-forming)/AMP-acid ligase II
VETAVAFWATLKANAVVSVVSPLTKADKLTYLLNDSRAAALVTDMQLAPVFGEAVPRAPYLKKTFVTGDFNRNRLPQVPDAMPKCSTGWPPRR